MAINTIISNPNLYLFVYVVMIKVVCVVWCLMCGGISRPCAEAASWGGGSRLYLGSPGVEAAGAAAAVDEWGSPPGVPPRLTHVHFLSQTTQTGDALPEVIVHLVGSIPTFARPSSSFPACSAPTIITQITINIKSSTSKRAPNEKKIMPRIVFN